MVTVSPCWNSRISWLLSRVKWAGPRTIEIVAVAVSGMTIRRLSKLWTLLKAKPMPLGKDFRVME